MHLQGPGAASEGQIKLQIVLNSVGTLKKKQTVGKMKHLANSEMDKLDPV